MACGRIRSPSAERSPRRVSDEFTRILRLVGLGPGITTQRAAALVSTVKDCAGYRPAYGWRTHAMRFAARLWRQTSPALLTFLMMAALTVGTFAQQPPAGQGATTPAATAPAAVPAGPPPNPNAAATAADHRNMMEQ